MTGFKQYSDDQLIRELDNLIEELEQRNLEDKFIVDSESHSFLLDVSKAYFPINCLLEAKIELEEEHGEDYENENNELLYDKLDKEFIISKFIDSMEESVNARDLIE